MARRVLLLAILVIVLALAGEGQGRARPVPVRVMGSTSLVALVEAVAPAYTRAHPDVSIHVSAGGSVAGLHAVAAGHVELGVSDVPPRWAGITHHNLVRLPLGGVPVVPIVHAGTGVTGVTLGELSGLLAGRVENWKEVGGIAEKVVVVTRGPGSGALLVMERVVMRGHPISPDAVVELSNGAVYRAVLATPGAVGFVEAGFVGRGVQALSVDGDTFSAGSVHHWPFSAPAALYYRRGAAAAVRDLARFVQRSPEKRRFGIYEEGSGGHGRRVANP